MKTVTIERRRYRVLGPRSYDGRYVAAGYELGCGVALPEGVGPDHPNLKSHVHRLVEQARANHAAALRALRQK